MSGLSVAPPSTVWPATQRARGSRGDRSAPPLVETSSWIVDRVRVRVRVRVGVRVRVRVRARARARVRARLRLRVRVSACAGGKRGKACGASTNTSSASDCCLSFRCS